MRYVKITTYILSFACTALLYTACKESPIVVYNQDRDGVYFADTDIKSDPEAPIDFANRVYRDLQTQKNIVSADSLPTDTLRYILKILGNKPLTDKRVYFRVRDIEDKDHTDASRVIKDAELLNIQVPSPFIFRAGLWQDTVLFIVHRPAEMQKLYGATVEIVPYEQDSRSDFSSGVKESVRAIIYASETYTKPSQWEPSTESTETAPVRLSFSQFYGEYSPAKHAFIQGVLQSNRLVLGDSTQMVSNAQKLKEALEAYNASHPQSPKPFTFPQLTSYNPDNHE